MKFAGLRSNERRLAVAAGTVIGCSAILSLVVQPLWDRAVESRRYAGTQTERLDAVGRLLTQSEEIERAYAAIAGYVQTGDEPQIQQALLNELEALAQAADVQIGLRPRPAKQQDRMKRFEIELDIEGAQQNLLAFVDSLLRMPRLVAIERLRMNGVPLKPELLRATIVLQHLTFPAESRAG
jgi:hypothetical protein